MMANDPRLAELTVLIESIVAQVLNKSFGEQMTTWAVNNPRTSLYLSHETGDRDEGASVARIFGQLYGFSDSMYRIKRNKNSTSMNSWGKYTNRFGSLAGVFGAYQSGDAIGGALSGYQLGQAFKFNHPLVGAAIGLLAGLFSHGIDKWYRPKFKTAKQAFEKMFTMDRGERDDYYMPDSFYFRTGWQGGSKKIIVKVGNNQFDDHIRESLTNAYESQLQRGLVF